MPLTCGGLSHAQGEEAAVTGEEVSPSWGQSQPVRAEGISVKPDSSGVEGNGRVRKERLRGAWSGGRQGVSCLPLSRGRYQTGTRSTG